MRITCALLFVLAVAACRPYYTVDDFSKVRKIDTHVHLNGASPSFGKLAEEDNFDLITVNVDVPGMPVAQQYKYALQQQALFPKDISFLASFSIPQGQPAGWQDAVISHLDSAFNNGALGIKVWKNIGMVERDAAGEFIMIDDPMFDPIIRFVIDRGKMVLGHVGEPKNCWLPLEEMTVNNDRNYFGKHPEYHMFLHPEFPSYQDLIDARDNFLEKHPDLPFVGAHLGSLEWSVDELAARLDKFPRMAVDMAARIPHLQYQSRQDRMKVRNFMIQYADRLIYATDGGFGPGEDSDRNRQDQHDAWMRDWRYLATADMITTPQVNGSFKGLQLPKEVINKIYFENAVKWFGIPAR